MWRKTIMAGVGFTIAAILLTIAAVFYARMTAYEKLYDFDPTIPQHYPLAERGDVSVEVSLSGSEIPIPALGPEIDTVFLSLPVGATLRGRLADPYIEINGAGIGRRQYFARNTRGMRHIDLSSFLPGGLSDEATVLDFELHGLELASEEGRISGFANPDPTTDRLLVLAPHPDDAELAAFGLYSDTNAVVATVTAGDAGTSYYSNLFDGAGQANRVLGRMRVWDSIIVPMIGGVPPSRAVNLGYFDGTLEEMYKRRNEPVVSVRSEFKDIRPYRELNRSELVDESGEPRWSGLVGDLGRLVAATEPKIIVAPHPFIDAHSDHRFTTIALCEALEAEPRQDLSLFLYMNYGIYSRNYPNGPRTSLVSLPPWYDEPFPFDSVFSYTLSDTDSAMKAIALEAHRDFREFDMRPVLSIGTRVRDLMVTMTSLATGVTTRRKGFFRYASRPNEIFFALPGERLNPMCSEFLDRWRGGEFGHYQ